MVDGERLGRWSLRIDAVYCASLGAAVAFLAPVLAGPLGIPGEGIRAAGAAVVVWAGVVAALLTRLDLSAALRVVMAANIVAALAVAAVSTIAGTALAVISVLAVAVDVALFAASQAMAPQRLPDAASP